VVAISEGKESLTISAIVLTQYQQSTDGRIS